MKINNLVLLLIAVCLSTQSHANSDNCATVANFVSLCDVLADAAKYDGKEIIVRGSYRMVIHGSVLMMSSCPTNLVDLRQAKDYVENQSALKIIRSNTRKDRFRTTEVVLRGTFHLARQGECFGQNCERYEIENRGFLCAELDDSKRQHK